LTADAMAQRVRGLGVMVSTVGPYRVRACTHLDVDAAGIALAVEAIAGVLR
jgi:threonine aldolase